MKRILVLALLLSNIIFASDFDVPMTITLKDNTYNLKSSCNYNIDLEYPISYGYR